MIRIKAQITTEATFDPNQWDSLGGLEVVIKKAIEQALSSIAKDINTFRPTFDFKNED